jgi:hypothetical protein
VTNNKAPSTAPAILLNSKESIPNMPTCSASSPPNPRASVSVAVVRAADDYLLCRALGNSYKRFCD